MTQDRPLSEDETIDALAECLRVFARRGRAIREAKEKLAAEQARSQVVNSPDFDVNTTCLKEKDTVDNSLKSVCAQGEQQPQVSIVPDQNDI